MKSLTKLLLVLVLGVFCNAQVGPVRLYVSAAVPSVSAGDTIQCGAGKAFFRNPGPGQAISSSAAWVSSSPAVATVDSTGLVTTHSQGSALITAASGPFRGAVSVSATTPVLRSIEILPQVPSIPNGFTQQFSAFGTYSDGSTVDITNSVTWGSQTTSVATIATTPAANPGLATSKGAGTSLITATDPVSSLGTSTTLTVTNATLQAVSVTPDPPANLPVGASEQFTATGTFSDGSTLDLSTIATWSTTPTGVASVTTTGLVTGVAPGSTVVNATVQGISDTLPPTLTVTTATLTSITVTPANIKLPAGTKQQYRAIGTYSDNSTADLTATVTWQSSATGFATINNAGLVTAVAPGPTTISATMGSVSGSTGLTVTGAVLVSVSISPVNPSTSAGLSVQFTATGQYSDGSTANLTNQVTWQSSDSTVAVITPAGLASTFKSGAVTISALYQGQLANTILTVTAPTITKINVSPANAIIPLHGTLQFHAIGVFSNGTQLDITTQVTWSTNNGKASIDANGLATGNSKGKTFVRAAMNGITGQVKASVQ